METEPKQTLKRIEWVDIGKYICIMFVMVEFLLYPGKFAKVK